LPLRVRGKKLNKFIKILKKYGPYLGPAVLVFLLFGVGYLLTAPEPTPQAKTEEPEIVAEPDIPAEDLAPDGTLLKDIYRYHTLVFPFTGNIHNSNKKFSAELAFTIYQNKFRSDVTIKRLDVVEKRIRPYLLEDLMMMTLEEASSNSGLLKIRKQLTETSNRILIELGDPPSIEDVVFITFLIL
jgi:flagellar basal body-associated protein FliL